MTVTLIKMGRRKQNCPQKTGNSSSLNPDEGEDVALHDENVIESDSVSGTSEKEPVPTLESLDPENKNNSANGMAPPASVSGTPLNPTGGPNDPLNIFKNPLFNPALLSLNPSLYAVQLAQLQAAQLLSAAASEESGSRKRKLAEEDSIVNLSSSKRPASPMLLRGRESPLDLTKETKAGVFSPSKLDPFAAAAALSPFLNPFLGAHPEMLLPGAGIPTSQGESFIRNPLERISEIVKGPSSSASSAVSSSSNATTTSTSSGKTGGPRHSAWQSQWINRGPENSKDIFKCVWCKDRFSSLQDLTTHMKETKHFGSQIPPPSPPQSSQLSPGMRGSMSLPKPPPPLPPPPPPPSTVPTSASSSPKARDLLKEQLPMPRKLVRGQDVWLGRGEQQTKDILKCMWCGQSFRSLDLMTKHMQETKHYTKVISQEQLSSWKAGDSNSSTSSTSSTAPALSTASLSQTQPQNHVNTVLTCKICETSFSTLRDLSDHMVKNNHYAESGGSAKASSSIGTPPPSIVTPKEKRKKSLPVRKLLELERAQQELIIGGGRSDEGKITCEKCSERIPITHFASHIHLCVGSVPEMVRRPPSSSAASSSTTPPSISPPSHKPSREEEEEEVDVETKPKSILGSLEKMVQSNFGSSKKKSSSSVATDGHLSILQRLGIDEGAPTDYCRPSEASLFRPMSTFFAGKFGASSRSDSSECSSPDRSKLQPLYPDLGSIKEEEKDQPKNSLPPSPANSQRSFQESHREEESVTPNSLVDKAEDSLRQPSPEDPAKKKNPLAALQMLCDKTEKPKRPGDGTQPGGNPSLQMNNGNNVPLPVATTGAGLYSDPGAILAFSWACNQAIVNDSLLKCPFCDTPFISKGAYRHHLSKMHFVKDDSKPPKGPDKSPSPNDADRGSGTSAKAENAQSKFQKYSQLAKQLSCSSQP